MIPASETLHHVIGLDLGRQTDPSALALLQWRTERRATTKPVYKLPTLKRWPLGTPYLDIARSVVKFLQTPLLAATPCWLVADATGVGSAVCEMLKEEIRVARVRAHMAQVLITAGSAVTLAPGGVWHVAKKQLVSTMQVVLGQRRLESAEVPEAATLDRELRTFSVKITDSANETFESWRERDHDDLVLAVALPTWWAERHPVIKSPPPLAVEMHPNVGGYSTNSPGCYHGGMGTDGRGTPNRPAWMNGDEPPRGA